MNKIKQFFLKEALALQNNATLKGKTPAQIMIAIRYTDGHIHTVIPPKDVCKQLIESLIEHSGVKIEPKKIWVDGI